MLLDGDAPTQGYSRSSSCNTPLTPYTGYMSSSPELEREAQRPPADQPSDALDIADGQALSSVAERRNARIYLRKDLADRLIKLGVPDDTSSLGNVVNELADMSITLGSAYLPDATDAGSLQAAIHDRLDELTRVTLSLLQLMVELGATGEYRTLLHSFKDLAKENSPKSNV